MSPSSDIETLFGHFGGNAGDYQEIGRENEAGTARTRWPLLVTLDLKQTPIPAIAQRRERQAEQAAQAGEGEAAQDTTGAAGASLAARATDAASTANPRSKAPLFARPHRRNVPPVAEPIKVDGPRGGERFGAAPLAGGLVEIPAVLPVAPVAPVAPVTPVAATAPVPPVAPATSSAAIPPVASIPPVAANSASQSATTHAASFATPFAGAGVMRPAQVAAPTMAVPSVFSRPAATAPASTRTFASAGLPPVAPSAPTAAAAFASAKPAAAPASPFRTHPLAAMTRPATPVQPAPQPPSILGRLFAGTAPQSSVAAPTAAAGSQPAELRSVFDRLRGASSNAAAPVSAPHSWLTNGPRRS
ncbi:cellulose biosynthesis protein BcsP [Paraburkholderia sp. DHOC27]|uniref:cellulose biosynthesis protein BcsP n=1 Tax=Paraburkholderia sp. DHOC27 TaxID=2303330 RepID=UPI0015F319BD|nr:cellulose biosynthesis protein BcsP [Paraburkholderia sp. DHOC27]